MEEEQILDRLVRDLHGEDNDEGITMNVFSGFQTFYPLGKLDGLGQSLNLVDQAVLAIAWYGTPTHSAAGVTFDGVAAYGSTGLNAATLPLYSKSAGISFKSIAPGNTWLWGAYNGNMFGQRILYNNWITGVGVNDYHEAYYGFGDAARYSAIDISSSAVAKLYGDGFLRATFQPGPTAPTENIILGGLFAGFLSQFTCDCFWIGNRSFSDAEHTAIHEAIIRYQTALGRL